MILSSICTAKQTEEAQKRIALYYPHICVIPGALHRKCWELELVARVLDNNFSSLVDKYCIAFGVGNDPTVLYLASKGARVRATDLSSSAWRFLQDHSSYLQYPEHIHYVECDMNNIPEDVKQEQWDFTWSLCSLDHLGSIQLGKKFVYESLKCLKLGGVAVHTGEFNCSSEIDTLDNIHTVLWLRKDIEEVVSYLQSCGYEIEFDESTFTSDDPRDHQAEHLTHNINALEGPFQTHVKVGPYVSTSFSLVIKKVSR